LARAASTYQFLLPTFRKALDKAAREPDRIEEAIARNKLKQKVNQRIVDAKARGDAQAVERIRAENASLYTKVTVDGQVVLEFLDIVSEAEPNAPHRPKEWSTMVRREMVNLLLQSGKTVSEVVVEITAFGIACTAKTVRNDVNTTIRPAAEAYAKRLGLQYDLFGHLTVNYGIDEEAARARRQERAEKLNR
jgi:hypothetical protein